jgi:hypothetical protein
MGIFAPFSYLEQRVIVPGVDPDAQAFITATGITDGTQQSAINTLVLDLKSAGIWTKLDVCYPFVGGTATTHKYNLIDPQDTNAAYRLTFFNSPTHNSDGVEFDGVSEYATTYFTPSTDFSTGGLNSNHVFASYFFAASGDDGTDWGIQNTSGGNFFQGGVRTSGNGAFGRNMSSTFTEISNTSLVYVYGQNRNSSTEYDINLGKTKTATSSTSSKLPPLDVYLGARNQNTAAGGFNNRGFNMFAIGAGLSDTEWDAWVDANDAFQTTLGR